MEGSRPCHNGRWPSTRKLPRGHGPRPQSVENRNRAAAPWMQCRPRARISTRGMAKTWSSAIRRGEVSNRWKRRRCGFPRVGRLLRSRPHGECCRVRSLEGRATRDPDLGCSQHSPPGKRMQQLRAHSRNSRLEILEDRLRAFHRVAAVVADQAIRAALSFQSLETREGVPSKGWRRCPLMILRRFVEVRGVAPATSTSG